VKSANKMIVLVALVCAAPFVSAWVAYYFYKPEGGQSYGTLLETKPLPDAATLFADDALKGKWRLVHFEPSTCGESCQKSLYVTRQARTMLGRDKDRVVRVALLGASPNDEIRQAHPDLLGKTISAQPSPELKAALEKGIVLIDPLGNQVMSWPKDADIKKLNRDLLRLMRASRIG
jgi:cytochrome oxidase Cu insertion factor (SCO1/SenC/PrrC family)